MITRFVAVVVLVACSTVQGATLKGDVRTAGGDSLPARITILSNAGGIALDTHDTRDDGTFSVEVEAEGLVAASVSAPGYASQEIDLSGGVPSRSVRFVLRPLQIVQGSVKDSEGRPQTGASVRVRRLGVQRRIHLDDASSAVTDESGAFAVAIPSGGSDRFVVDVEADGWVPQSSGVLDSGSAGNTGVGEGSLESVLISLGSRGPR